VGGYSLGRARHNAAIDAVTIAIGMALKGPVDPRVLICWMRILRDRSWPGPIYDYRDVYPADARNKITRDFLNGPADSLFMFDSDQLPPLLVTDQGKVRYLPDVLEEITEPVVCGLVYKREPPYEPVAYKFRKGKREYLTPGEISDLVAVRGMKQVDSYGSGSLLIRRRVLEHLAKHRAPAPIWESDPNFDYDEGWKFCHDVTALGYRIWLDSRIEAAHLETRPITSRDYFEAHGYKLAD
jgi:hypothetical protein